MNDKVITPEELHRLHKGGAKITHEEGPTEISGWPSLIEQLSNIAKSNEVIANKKSEQIKEALESLAEVIALKKDVDIKPIMMMLGEIQKNSVVHNKTPHAYIFEVERDQRGLLKTIIAKPMSDK